MSLVSCCAQPRPSSGLDSGQHPLFPPPRTVSSALSRSTTIPSGDNLESVERIHVGRPAFAVVCCAYWIGVDVEGPKERSTLATSTTNKRYSSLGEQTDSVYRARSRESYGALEFRAPSP
jgi:hypothetical protein